MKNIFKWMIPCLAVAFALTSCDSTMDDKATIDAKYEKASSATVALGSVSAVDFQTITAAATVGSEAQVIEEGIQICSSADFASGITSVPNDTVEASYSINVAGLAEQTTYYVRAYAVTRTAGTIVTEPQSVTTPKTPIFPLDGIYLATEWDVETGEAAGQYPVEITFDEADPTIVNITNIWGAESTVQGQYDEATGLITVPNMQVIYEHPTYGEVWLRAVDPEEEVYLDAIYFQFTALGGKMESTPMAAQCEVGDFSWFYLTMEHQ